MHSDKVTTTAGDGGRKSSKPIMEKKRRARINASLAELKSLLLEAIKKEGSRHSKMEKADILELTVKHLRQAQRHPSQVLPVGNDPSSLSKYRQLGFNECVQEASRYLSSIDSCDVELRTRLLNHLANCITRFDDAPMSPSTTSQSPTSPMTSHSMTSPSPPPPPLNPSRVGEPISIALATSSASVVRPEPVVCVGTVARAVVSSGSSSGQRILPSELNNNTVIIHGGGAGASGLGFPVLSPQAPPQQQQQPLQMGKIFSGIQVIPTKLASGEIAFVVPANVLASQTSGSYVIPVYASQTVVSTSSNPVPSEASTSSVTMMTSVASAMPVMSNTSMNSAVTHTATSAVVSSQHTSLPVSPATLPVSVTPLPSGVISFSTPGALGVTSAGILPIPGPLPAAPPPPPPPPPSNVFGVSPLYSDASSSEASPVKSAFFPPLSLSGASPNVVSAFPADSSGVQDPPRTFSASVPRVHVPLATPACSLPKVVFLQGPQQLPQTDSVTGEARRRLGFGEREPSEEGGESSGQESMWRPW